MRPFYVYFCQAETSLYPVVTYEFIIFDPDSRLL